MIRPENRQDKATIAILDHGCPICGTTEGSIFVDDAGDYHFDPCGHIVTPDDALHMASFYSELQDEGD